MATIGIDFGTAGTRASCYLDDGIVTIPNMHNKEVTPTVVTINNDGELSVGDTAEKGLLTYPHMTEGNFKRYIGTEMEYSLRGNSFSANELSSLVLKSIKDDAQDFLGEECINAVINVPCYYDHVKRKAVMSAAKEAGFNEVHLVNESALCALSYVENHKDKTMRFFVMSIGSGTFDASVFYLNDGNLYVQSIGGDDRIGGEDFTCLIETHFIDNFNIDRKRISDEELALIHNEAERCKIGLSDNETASMNVSIKGNDYKLDITRDEFKVLSNKILTKIKHIVEEVLDEAGVRFLSEEIDSVVITGGSMKMPILKDVVQKMFNSVQCVEIDSEKCISYGAALQGAFIDNKFEKEKIITIKNICPYTLGMKTTGRTRGQDADRYYFNPLIGRNTSIPNENVKSLYPQRNNQYDMEIGLYEAHDAHGENSILLGGQAIKLPECSKDEEIIKIGYRCDNNGIFKVTAFVDKADKEIILVNDEDDNFIDESRKRLRKLDGIKAAQRNEIQSIPRKEVDNIPKKEIHNILNADNAEYNIINRNILHEPFENDEESVEEFIQKAEDLYNDFFKRIYAPEWEKFLCSDALWSLENSEDLRESMIKFLMKHYHLPQDVWKLLEETFKLNDMKKYVEMKYPHDLEDILRVFKNINNNAKLRYCYFGKGQAVDYDTFLTYRDNAFDSIISGKYEEAEKYINDGEKIYDNDPDMLLIKGITCMELQKEDKALKSFDKAIEIDSENLSARFYRARVKLLKGMIKEALDDCRYIEEYGNDSYVNKGPDIIYVKEDEYATTDFNNIKAFKVMYAECLYEMNKLCNDKGLKEKLNELYSELGIRSEKDIKKNIVHIIMRRIILCLVIAAVQFSLLAYGINQGRISDFSPENTVKKVCRYLGRIHELKEVGQTLADDMEMAKVKGEISNASFLGLYRISHKDDLSKNNTEYLTFDVANEKDVYKYSDGYVCQGTIGGSKVILVADYEQAQSIYKDKSLDFEGIIHYMDDDMNNKIRESIRTEGFKDGFRADVFIDTTLKTSNRIEFSLSCAAILLFVQAVIIIQGISLGIKKKKQNKQTDTFAIYKRRNSNDK